MTTRTTHLPILRATAFALVLLALVAAILAQPRPASHASAALNADCTLLVPAHPLTAAGLATPYQLRATDPDAGPCSEANPAQQAFVQAGVLNPASGAISIYDPLVVTAGTQPAIAPTAPSLPAGAIVALWFGDNGSILRLVGADANSFAGAFCVSGVSEPSGGFSRFGQVSACNAAAFFTSANARIAAHGATGLAPAIPPLGMASDGQPCPSVRDAMLVDQDPSDNVTTTYLVTAAGAIAQNTAANRAALASAGAQVDINGSDNKVLALLDAALGCTPYEAPDLADGGAMTPAQPLNELQAAMFQGNPVDLVPVRDDMTELGVPIASSGVGTQSVAKTDAYRALVDQPALTSMGQGQAEQVLYCASLYLLGAPRLAADSAALGKAASPFPTMADSLYTFLALRLDATVGAFPGLRCTDLLGLSRPFALQLDDATGVVIGATLNAPYPAG